MQPSARPQIFGILNLTPDSFSDGGQFDRVDAAVAHARRMFDEGADAIDVGGESTRPGASRIDAKEQIRRVVPVIEAIVERCGRQTISIDTTRAVVAEAALDAGASIINDVSAGREDERLFALAAERGAAIILMHMRGEPATMQRDPSYEDVVTEVRDFLLARADAAQAAGIPAGRIILDPGIGFGKTTAHNLELLANLSTFVRTGYTIMLGTSRKRFLGEITGEKSAADRAVATAATTALGVAAGVQQFRVHDVQANRQAADVAWAVGNRRAVT
jgi:dihydropteroate synthase